MKNRWFLTAAVLMAGVGGVLTTGTSAAAAEAPTAQPSAMIKCHPGTGFLTVKHRAPVHTQPSAASRVKWIASKGATYRTGGYCDNSYGNRWYCVAGCDFRDNPRGYWIWEKYIKA